MIDLTESHLPGNIIGGQYPQNPGHGQGSGGIDSEDTGSHPAGPHRYGMHHSGENIVIGVLCLAGNFGPGIIPEGRRCSGSQGFL
jgi:hypothetical protein